jgi:hypothetical protein
LGSQGPSYSTYLYRNNLNKTQKSLNPKTKTRNLSQGLCAEALQSSIRRFAPNLSFSQRGHGSARPPTVPAAVPWRPNLGPAGPGPAGVPGPGIGTRYARWAPLGSVPGRAGHQSQPPLRVVTAAGARTAPTPRQTPAAPRAEWGRLRPARRRGGSGPRRAPVRDATSQT